MRLIKMAGLTAAVALVAMAFVGVSSAMAEATQLCTADRDVGGVTEPCTSGGGTLGSAVTHVHNTDPLALLFGERFGVKLDILCEALFLGDVLGLANAGTGGQIIHGTFTYTGPHGTTSCVDMVSGKNCLSVKEVAPLGGLLAVLREGLELAKVTGSEFVVLVECNGFHCEYEASGLVGHGLGPLLAGGGTTGNTTISAQTVNNVGGFLCPTTSKLTTTQTSLTAVYMAK